MFTTKEITLRTVIVALGPESLENTMYYIRKAFYADEPLKLFSLKIDKYLEAKHSECLQLKK